MNTTEKAPPIQRRVPIPTEAIPPGMVFHHSHESVWDDPGIFGYATVIERAWHEMDLDGVLCLDGRPVLYLREYNRPCSSSERIRLHKLFWNQGVANVLLLIDPDSVYLYSGLMEPRVGEDETKKEPALVEKLKIADYAQCIYTLFQQLATGRFYEIHPEKFEPNQAVDSHLLENLRDFRSELIEGDDGLDIRDTHAFIGRVLFLCYLLDREIVDIGKPEGNDTATTLLARELSRREDNDARMDYLYRLFEELRKRFNGNMFDRDLDAEKRRIRPHMEKLSLFLGGHEVRTGQLSQWPYDFKMIPVETISAIYQDFLAAEDKEGQRETGAFYTPRFLAEMVVDVAMGEAPDAADRSFLDPACGSGIFLVLLFNRLAGRCLAENAPQDYLSRAEALQDILRHRIRGIDVSETACRIACFSLYLAYLDFFEPADIEKYIQKTGGRLPKFLHDPDNPEQPADIPVIDRADFLAIEDRTFFGEEFPDGRFDCVIGNPPWEGRGSKQIAQRFLQEAPRFLKEGGTGCFLLPTKLLHNQTDKFQAEWFGRVTLERVLQLADYRKLLFQGAKTPGFIARFENTAPNPNQHAVEFIAPKFNRDGLRKGVITINPTAPARIPLAELLAAARSEIAPVLWKTHLWGTPRDRKLLDLLQSLPPLAEQVDVLSDLKKKGLTRTKRWRVGQGLKPWKIDKIPRKSDPTPKKNHWPLDMPFIETKREKIDFVLFGEDTISFKERLEKKKYRNDVLYSDPPDELFLGPKVLVNQGFDKVAYCDFDVLFQHSLQSIAGPEEDIELLLFLAAYLRSGLARYFGFHTAANWGTERDKVHLDELLRVPFPLPGHGFIATDATEIIAEVAEKVRQFGENPRPQKMSLFKEDPTNIDKDINTGKWRKERKRYTDALQREIEPLIYRYFGLTEQEIILVEDAIGVFMPSATPGTRWPDSPIPTLEPVLPLKSMGSTKVPPPYGKRGLGAYADTLTHTLNRWAEEEGSDYRVSAEGGTDGETGFAMVTLRLGGSAEGFRPEPISRSLAETLKSYYETVSRKTGTLVYERDILFFQGERIHIVRPNILLNWTRTMALNDAARIYGEIVLGEEGSNAG
uniref:site-specific DNA-methyltransferase (adenine-specific) n=1 Tax=Candidatus Kentrum sp. FW TaxID=2126338 RepID=A0A450TUM9_9GAMM|nr:MAG: N-6 DNA Methylase [Candidatus Kentron sp. FW]